MSAIQEKTLEEVLQDDVIQVLNDMYSIEETTINFQKTRKDFEGDLTVVVFPYLKAAKKAPEMVAQEIGESLKEKSALVADFNVVKGFLNLKIASDSWMSFFEESFKNENYGIRFDAATAGHKMVEYSSPNTNKPLHLGHVRNILLGYSVSQILAANNNKVEKVQVINDRGIHICKSMLAWQKFGNGETPDSSGIKGDHLVGKYYVQFDVAYKAEVKALIEAGRTEEEAKKEAAILLEAQEMLRQWEAGNEEVVSLWETMNSWCYKGFDVTYNDLGVHFDKLYYESNTYLLGKEQVMDGIEKGVFFKKEDGSVWCDLTDEGLDHKLVLRSDGTAVYMTQDIGTAIERFKDFNIDSLVYTVADEQDYHFKVLFLILKKLGYEWNEGLYHLSYGMVDLPSGRMKSREGTVVDADDLMSEMRATAKAKCEEKEIGADYPAEELNDLYRKLGMSALKYYLLKVEPKKRITFNPEESIEFTGNTGPSIQYSYVRTRSIARKATEKSIDFTSVDFDSVHLHDKEIELLKLLKAFPKVVSEAAGKYSPAHVANYNYELAKEFNQYYDQVGILIEEDENLRAFRINLSLFVGNVLKNGMALLGIEMPERM